MSITQDRGGIKWAFGMALGASGHATPAQAHASEQGFVLLLPTDLYISAGTAVVALTILLLIAVPGGALARLFRPVKLWRTRGAGARVTSLLSTCVLLWLIWVGTSGPRDPLSKPMPLAFWTVFWIGLVSVQGVVGDIWRWINPWSGMAALIRQALGVRPVLHWPARWGRLPALVGFLAFAGFLLADPAPSDPARLARLVGLYWLSTLIAVLLFGPRWLICGEAMTVLMRSYGRMGLLGRTGQRLALGLPGWQTARRGAPPLGAALFVLLLLGSGSFDGLNETFWWLSVLGLNPLEFPGRSAIILQTLAGLAAVNLALIAGYGVSVWLGLRLTRGAVGFAVAFRALAPSMLPIALGYHVAHYLPSFLVDIQYAVAAATDPWANGADWLGLGTFYVTTGFFNTQDTVRVIWMSQAAAVVLGHVLAVLLAHLMAARLFAVHRLAALSQAPLALFMVGYTLFGLWLLASPRGM